MNVYEEYITNKKNYLYITQNGGAHCSNDDNPIMQIFWQKITSSKYFLSNIKYIIANFASTRCDLFLSVLAEKRTQPELMQNHRDFYNTYPNHFHVFIDIYDPYARVGFVLGTQSSDRSQSRIHTDPIIAYKNLMRTAADLEQTLAHPSQRLTPIIQEINKKFSGHTENLIAYIKNSHTNQSELAALRFMIEDDVNAIANILSEMISTKHAELQTQISQQLKSQQQQIKLQQDYAQQQRHEKRQREDTMEIEKIKNAITDERSRLFEEKYNHVMALLEALKNSATEKLTNVYSQTKSSLIHWNTYKEKLDKKGATDKFIEGFNKRSNIKLLEFIVEIRNYAPTDPDIFDIDLQLDITHDCTQTRGIILQDCIVRLLKSAMDAHEKKTSNITEADISEYQSSHPSVPYVPSAPSAPRASSTAPRASSSAPPASSSAPAAQSGSIGPPPKKYRL